MGLCNPKASCFFTGLLTVSSRIQMSIPKVEYNAATQKYKSRRFNQTNSFQLAPNWSDQSQKKKKKKKKKKKQT